MSMKMSFPKEETSYTSCETSVTNLPSDSQPVDCAKDFFGPALPPHFSKGNFPETEEREVIYGPILPNHLKCIERNESSKVYCPVVEENNKNLIGPKIPECLDISETSEKESTIGFRGDDCLGPSTALMATGDDTSCYNLLNLQSLPKKTGPVSESNIKRESWMLELPEKKRGNFGLISRHFKSQIQTDKESDDSVWTDTPADKKKKEISQKKTDYKEIARMKRMQERDKEMEKLAKKAKKKLKKKESLLEMHLKSMKKKKKIENKKRNKEGKPFPERRPFDRDVDLQIRKIDEGQKKAILNKSQFLNDRFAPGQSKFL